MARPDKAAAIAELTEKFRSSGAAVLTEYRGLTVAQLTTLRTDIREHATYAVVKNTLTEIAAKEAGVTAFDGQFSGPSAIAFITGDPVGAAKGLRDFAKANPHLVIKAGVLDGKALTPAEIFKLADLESREVLLAKLAGAMKASLSNAVYLFAAPLSQAARVLDALRAKIEAENPAVVAEAPTESVDTAPLDTPVADNESVADVDAPADTTEDAPADTNEGAPADTNEGAPADTNEDAPADTNEDAPADTTEDAPADTNEGAPADTNEVVATGGDES